MLTFLLYQYLLWSCSQICLQNVLECTLILIPEDTGELNVVPTCLFTISFTELRWVRREIAHLPWTCSQRKDLVALVLIGSGPYFFMLVVSKDLNDDLDVSRDGKRVARVRAGGIFSWLCFFCLLRPGWGWDFSDPQGSCRHRVLSCKSQKCHLKGIRPTMITEMLSSHAVKPNTSHCL